MATAAPGGDHLVVTAIDFGTTYSGYAFSFKHDPTKVQTNQGWNAGSERLISYKTPTCVLVNPQKKFDSFGYDAENKYVSLVDEEKHEGWMLFRRFKMILHNEEVVKSCRIISKLVIHCCKHASLFNLSLLIT